MKKLLLILIAIVFACETNEISSDDVKSAANISGLQFTQAERDSMLDNLYGYRNSYDTLRAMNIGNDVAPALQFDPLPAGVKPVSRKRQLKFSAPERLAMPDSMHKLAFYTVRELAHLIRTKQISSVELTEFFLERLKKYGPQLECVITLTEERALREARRADAELASGKYRGLLHGIPYGAKDLLATRDYKTSWGAVPYQDQQFEEDATVIRKLEEAGAVLVAKLTLGALAWGDVWYGGKTRNPWNPEQGSSGSSAGSSAATAAGLVPFAIGTETWGSIVSPSVRCGTTGLRPTFGRVSRHGAMALSWSMDKIGPICRSVEDCAIVFNAIYGPDGQDNSVRNFPFDYAPEVDWPALRIGYIESAFKADSANREFNENVLETLRGLGANLVPFELPDFPVYNMTFILSAEAATAFDDLTRSNRDDLMVRQIKNAWPNEFRSARLIPAVEYIQANRARSLLIREMQETMRNIDVYICPPFGGTNLLLTNLTGHPAVVLPVGFRDGQPRSITLMGRLFDEGTLLAVANAWQQQTDFHKQHPPMFK